MSQSITMKSLHGNNWANWLIFKTNMTSNSKQTNILVVTALTVSNKQLCFIALNIFTSQPTYIRTHTHIHTNTQVLHLRDTVHLPKAMH